MKRILAMTAAAMMSTAMVGAATAQDVGIDAEVGAGAGAGAETGVGTDDLGATGATEAGANVGAVLSAVNTGQLGTTDIEAASEITSVNVVRIDELPGGEEQAALDEALDRHQAEIDDLRAAVEANAELSSALEAEGVMADQVVAAQTDANGSVTVFVR